MTNSPAPQPTEVNRTYLPLVLIVLGLVVWGVFLAYGAFLGVSDQVPDRDPRRAWIMLISSGSFLLFWLSALSWRARRIRRATLNRSSSTTPK